LICCIIEAEKIVDQEEKEQKEAEDMFQAKSACIAAAEAAKPKTYSVQVKPIPGVTNQGGTIVFGGGRTVLYIEDVQEPQSSSNWSECCGIIFSTKKQVMCQMIYPNARSCCVTCMTNIS